MKTRFFAVILAALMLLCTVACAADEIEKPAETTPQVSDTTAPAETDPPVTEPAYKPQLPEIKFENQELIILHRSPTAQHYKELYLLADNITGDIVNDAVYRRNLAIEEKYGIDIVNVINDDVTGAIQISAQAQSDEYDITFPQMRTISGVTTSGYLYNLHELDHVDFEKPYWDTNFSTDLTLENKLYAMVSDISLMNLINARGIIFNRDLVHENNLENPYDLVRKNQWTLEKMIEMA